MTRQGAQVEQMGTAMQWVLRLRDESVTEHDLAEWLAWYEADERNKKAFDEMQDFWRQMGRLPKHAIALPPVTLARSVARRAPSALLAACAAGAVAFAIWHFPQSTAPASNPVQVAQETPLPDGSKVELSPRTSVAVRYTEKERALEMRGGEAYFTVAPNHDRPFVVAIGGVRVRAVGTAFDIRHADQRIVVTVTNGAVDVYDQASTLARVTAGNALVLKSATAAPEISAADARRALAWRSGRLEYINEPLSAVIADVSRYASLPITMKDDAAAQLSFTGTVFTNSVEDWLQALPGAFPVEIVTRRDQRLIVGRGAAAK